MIDLDGVQVVYAGARTPTLRDVDLHVGEGELVLVVGPTGSGKSTLLGVLNGLVPHFSGGTLAGRVRICGRDTATHPPRELADIVGVVGQDPAAGFVTDTVEEELAYGMEQLAVAPATMRKRVEEVLDLLGIADLRHRPLHELSGGQQQRVAIGSVLTAHPAILVLDEPTSALDPTAADEVLATITRLVHDLGVTVVMAEHRLERVVHYADRVVEVTAGRVHEGLPAPMMADSRVAPPVVQLGRLAGWSPLPLSVRDARRAAIALRGDLAGVPVPLPSAHASAPGRPGPAVDPKPVAVLQARGIAVRYGASVAVRHVDLDLAAGQVVALMGRNGSGKSSLLWTLQGSGPRQSGTVRVSDPGSGGMVDPKEAGPTRARHLVGLVPQTPADLLYLDTVAKECQQADADALGGSGPAPAGPAGAGPDPSASDLLALLSPGVDPSLHPRDLSEGQRLALVLAIQLAAAPPVVALDEPTRGLDYAAKEQLCAIVARLARGGRAVIIATHDVEFAAACAGRVVVMAEGDIVADGDAADVLASSPAYAPQVAKVLAPLPFLTVGQVSDALRRLAC